MIDRETGLSNIEKFNHLRICLQGQALDTIKAFQITGGNYTKALDRLKARYDNNTLIFMENITALFQLPTINKNATELRSLVDNASALFSSLSSLGSDKDISNALLIYIVMEKVDEKSGNRWKNSLHFTNLPTWADCSALLERHRQFLQSIDEALLVQRLIRVKRLKLSQCPNIHAHCVSRLNIL